jgi:hypothetical protein
MLPMDYEGYISVMSLYQCCTNVAPTNRTPHQLPRSLPYSLPATVLLTYFSAMVYRLYKESVSIYFLFFFFVTELP